MDTPKRELLMNLDRLHTTELGIVRIKRNLQLNVEDVISWCKQTIADHDSTVTRKGKNWYILAGNCELTVNANSYTVITAHRKK